MTTFALVHGAWHSASSWEYLEPLLRRHGHDVVSMNLPSEDACASFDTYADVVCAALERCDDDVQLVGHSMAGHTIPLVAARRPIRRLVYLCALLPAVGRALADQLGDQPNMLNPLWNTGFDETGQTWIDRELARVLFYHDCADSVAETALDRLRPQATYLAGSPFSLDRFPNTNCSSVVCSDDRMVSPSWSKSVARERLGTEVIEIAGGHSPFLSRPAALAEVLLSLADADRRQIGHDG